MPNFKTTQILKVEKKTHRQIASQLAKKFVNRQITYMQFCHNYPQDTKDIDIESLLDLIEHQPKLDGFMGVDKSTYDAHNSEINKLIQLLEK